MIRMSLDEVVPPMRLAQSILTRDGRILLGQGATLTTNYVDRLRNFDIRHVWIRDDRLSDVMILEHFSSDTRSKISMRLSEIFAELRTDKTALRKILAGGIFDRLVQEALDNRREPMLTPEEAPMEDPLVGHSVRVCMLATGIGALMSYGREQLQNLAIGSLVHDVGKVCPMVRKRGELEDEASHHPTDGFDVVLRARHLSATIGVICLQHHERIDGSGVPRGLSGEAIHPFARLVAIADRFDSLVLGPDKILPKAALDMLRLDAENQFDPEMAGLFNKSVAPYPPGTPVRLSTGEQAVVIRVDHGKLDQPTVRILDPDLEPRDLSLSEAKEITIEAISWKGPVLDKNLGVE